MILRVIFILLFAQTAFSQYYQSSLDLKNKLSQNSVRSIIEDKEGFYWFSTGDGLNRFDGKTVKIFRNDPSNNNSICGNAIYDLRIDHLNNLWIATSTCLSKLDLSDYSIQNIYDEQNPESSSDNYNIEFVLFHDYLAVLTLAGLKFLHIESEQIINIPNSLNLNYIDIAKIDNNTLLVATNEVIYTLDINTKAIQELFDFSTELKPKGQLRDIYYAESFLFMSFTDQVVAYDFKDKELLTYDDIGIQVTRDINQWDNKIWFSTSNGLVTFDLSKRLFAHGTEAGLTEGVAIKTYKTIANNLLVSKGTSVIQLSKTPPLFKTILIDDVNKSGSGTNSVWNINVAQEGIFLSTENGIYIMDSADLSTPCTEMFPFLPDLNFVSNIVRDKNNIWISTFDSGLYDIDWKTKKTTRYFSAELDEDFIKRNVIWHVFDGGDYLLVSSTDGLFRIDKALKKVAEYDYYDPALHTALSEKTTTSFVDNEGSIWIGTQGCLLYTSPSPRDRTRSRMPSSA